jgi:hypothetical protein
MVILRATLTYRDFLTLDATLRREISSTLPSEDNAYNYYAVSSWLFSHHLEIWGGFHLVKYVLITTVVMMHLGKSF